MATVLLRLFLGSELELEVKISKGVEWQGRGVGAHCETFVICN